MNKQEIQKLVECNLDDLAKITLALGIQIDESTEKIGYLQFVLLQYGKAFDKMAKYGGNPNLSIQENFDRASLKKLNPGSDVHSVAQNYATQQINREDYKCDGKSIFDSRFMPDIYLPTSLNNEHLQVPLVNLARLNIAEGGKNLLEQKRLALQSGLTKLSDSGQNLFNLIIDTANKSEYVFAYVSAYLQRFNYEGGLTAGNNGYQYSLFTPYHRGTWNNSRGDFDEEGGDCVISCRI